MSTEQITSQILDLVRATQPGAQAEVWVSTVDRALTRFANSFIHQNVSDATTDVLLRVHVDGHTATGTTTVVGTDGLRGLVERTLEAARLSPADPGWPGLAPYAPVPSSVAVDEATAYAEPAERAARVRAFVDAVGGLEAAGYCSTTRTEVGFANSAGQSAHAVTAEASFDAIARNAGSDGLSRLNDPRLAAIDGTVLGRRAAAKANAGLDPVELAPGRYEVVLEPPAVYDVLFNMALFGFNGKALNEQRSFVSLGDMQFDPTITIIDRPEIGGLPFDGEGTPRGRLTLVDAGVTTAVAYDRRSAAEAGAASTGHGLAGGTSFGAALTGTEIVAPAGGAEVTEVDGPIVDSSVASLVAGVGRGLLVTDYWYTRVLDPRSLVVTGLTRNGVWLIEDGQVTTPVRNMRFTQAYPEALGPGQVLGIGTHAVDQSSEAGLLTYRVPALRLASWNLTGNASG